jgi:UDP-N-acetylmuramate: L-alanyl-gamma-D-glutamyl-meso-diaminopimelate ligase
MTSLTVTVDGRQYGRYRTPLAGMFNVRNCLGVIAASEVLGLDRSLVAEALAEFKSVKRRMQVLAVVGGVTVIDDFAHHPTAVFETLSAARQKYPGHRVVAVFEPRSYTAQRREFQQDFENALARADKVIIAGLFHPERYSAETAIVPEKMIERLRERGLEADFIPSPGEIALHLRERLKSDDVVVIMSNGSFGGLHEKLIAALNESKKS